MQPKDNINQITSESTHNLNIFSNRINLTDTESLKIDDTIDHRDFIGRYLLETIASINKTGSLKILIFVMNIYQLIFMIIYLLKEEYIHSISLIKNSPM